METAAILTLDPSAVIRQLIVELGADCQVKVLQSASPEDARQKIEKYQDSLRLVLLEWHLPGENGLDFLERCQEHSLNVPFIFVTTETDKKHVLQALKKGASDFVIKPFCPKHMKQKIRHFLG